MNTLNLQNTALSQEENSFEMDIEEPMEATKNQKQAETVLNLNKSEKKNLEITSSILSASSMNDACSESDTSSPAKPV
mgnify:CR=1 FL=1